MLRAKNIHKSYGQLEVLKGVSVSLDPGELVALVGSSGAGKSTLLQILGTLDDADKGNIHVGTRDVTQMNTRQKAEFRNATLGFVFQFHHLLPEFSALENVCMPAWIAGEQKPATFERGKMLLDKLGLGARTEHKPSELSGGEQQRVSMARALINQPKLIRKYSSRRLTKMLKQLQAVNFDIVCFDFIYMAQYRHL
ncbi:MAG: ATP-binding cassette domain-containing protein, partial [Bacteroidota bacterium]